MYNTLPRYWISMIYLKPFIIFYFLMQTEPEFRPTMSEVVQSLVRCVQRTSISKRIGGDLSSSRCSDDSDW
jgi:hypothetical protein